MKQQQAGLRGDEHARLIGHLETATPLEVFLGKKDLGVALELAPVRLREAVVERELADEQLAPFGRKRPGANGLALLSLAPFEKAEHQPLSKRVGTFSASRIERLPEWIVKTGH